MHRLTSFIKTGSYIYVYVLCTLTEIVFETRVIKLNIFHALIIMLPKTCFF